MLMNWMKVTPYKKTEDIWIYQLEPANTIIGLILIGLLTLFFVLFAIQNNMVLNRDHYLFFILIGASIFLLITKKKILEISRRDKTINKWSQVLFFKKSKIYPINDFVSIKIFPETIPVEEDYKSIVYSLVLSIPGTSIEIVSLHDKEEAKKHLDELSTFLNLRAENTPAKP
jgi:hypothetical protein